MNNYQFACNIDLPVSPSVKKETPGRVGKEGLGGWVPIWLLIKRDSRRDGSAGSLKSLIHSSSGRGGCPAAALVTFSAFSTKSQYKHKKQEKKVVFLGGGGVSTLFACQAAILACSRPICR
jgi:hypothetical protein